VKVLGRFGTAMLQSPLFDSVVRMVEGIDREPNGVLRVLTYHRVERADADPAPQGGVTASPEAFAAQMDFLAARCHVLSVDDVLREFESPRGLPRRAVLITFDDGYRDFRANAWPVLKARGLPVVVFIPTAFPGDPTRWFWWDRLHHALGATAQRELRLSETSRLRLETPADREQAFAELRARAKSMEHEQALAWVNGICDTLGIPPPPSPVMDWSEIRALAAEGVRFASHTRTHPLLTRIPVDDVRRELVTARGDLERELGSTPAAIAYPAGAFDDQVVRMAREAGYGLGFTTVRGVNPMGIADPLRLRRINVGRGTTSPIFRGQLTGWFAGWAGFRSVPEAA
jgi:peptidoglycan/xylan/chitin deacetylase (PgdA/CDA1 family)